MRLRARRVGPMTRRFTRALATVLAVCGLVAAPLSAAASTRPGQVAPAVGSAANAATLTVAVAGGGVARPGQDVQATATISNDGPSLIPSGTVTLWINDSGLDSRAELGSWLDSNAEDPAARALGAGTVVRLEPGSTATLHLTVPAASVGLTGHTSTEVFGIGATLSAPEGSRIVDHSSMVWSPGGSTPTTNVAVATSITTPASPKGLIGAKDLETYTSPNGLLSRQLDGLFGYPDVAVGLDPRILASINVLGDSAPTSAIEWLQRLHALPNDIFPLQYADADAAGEVQSGLTKLLSPTSLAWAMDPSDFTGERDRIRESPEPTGTATPGETTSTPTPTPTSTPSNGPSLPSVKRLLSWPYTRSDIVWPAEGTVRTADLPVFAADGLTTTILSGANTTAASVKGTPNASVKVPAGTAVASDPGVSSALRDAVTATSDSDWDEAMSRLNAQLALISAEKGSPRTILATLERGWPSDPTMLPRTLQELQTEPWQTPVTLAEAIASPSTSGLSIKDAPEDPARIATIQQLRADEVKLEAFSSVLENPATMTGPTRVRLLSLLGVAWLNEASGWDTAAAKSIEATVTTLQSITIVPASNVNVASTEAPIPITVENALDKPVTIVLSASPSNGRLEIDGTTTKTLQPDSRGTVIVPVKATLGNGHVRLTLSLHSPTGVPIGDAAVLPVQVHADWEGVGALVIGILVVLLFGFGIVRNILRHRSERRTAEAGTPATEEDSDGDVRG